MPNIVSSDPAQNSPALCSGLCPGFPTAPPAEPLPLALLQNFLYRCVGTTLGAASSEDVVNKHLRELLQTARYQEEAEHEVPAPPGRPGPRAG